MLGCCKLPGARPVGRVGRRESAASLQRGDHRLSIAPGRRRWGGWRHCRLGIAEPGARRGCRCAAGTAIRAGGSIGIDVRVVSLVFRGQLEQAHPAYFIKQGARSRDLAVRRSSGSLGGQFLGFGQAQLAGDQAGEQGVAEGGEGLGLLSICMDAVEYRT